MRITIGRGNRRESIEIPSGSKVGVTAEHVEQMISIMQNSGVRIAGR